MRRAYLSSIYGDTNEIVFHGSRFHLARAFRAVNHCDRQGRNCGSFRRGLAMDQARPAAARMLTELGPPCGASALRAGTSVLAVDQHYAQDVLQVAVFE